jgi:hypothetical protein
LQNLTHRTALSIVDRLADAFNAELRRDCAGRRPGVPSIAARATLFAEIFAKLEEAYHARLRVFLLKFLLVRLKPAVRRGIIKAATAHGRPVSFDLRITVHPHDASGFARVVGALLSDDSRGGDQPDHPPDTPEDGPYMIGLFGKPIPVSRLNTKRRRFGRRK